MERIVVQGNRLIVSCDLHAYVAREFEAKCEELLAVDAEELVMDLSGIREIGSMFVASLVQTCVAATGAGKKVRLRVKSRHQSFFDFADADPNISLDIVEDGRPNP